MVVVSYVDFELSQHTLSIQGEPAYRMVCASGLSMLSEAPWTTTNGSSWFPRVVRATNQDTSWAYYSVFNTIRYVILLRC